jgi:exonuclease SbcC
MTLDKLILDNFLTYDHFEYEFEKKPLLIQGLNLTDDNQKTNGTGKSGIQTGIEFCITASNSRDVRDNELVTYGEKEAETQLFASCDVRKESIHIAWTIKIKGSNQLVLKLKHYDSEDWNEVSFSNVNDGKKYILNWFAISKEDLFNYFIINNSRFKSFFRSSNKEKVDLINRFSDASIIKGLEDVDNTKFEDQLEEAKRKQNVTQGKIELIESQIFKEKNRDFKSEMEEEISDLKDEIIFIKDKIEKENTSIETKLKEIKLISINVAEEKENINVAKSDKKDIKTEIEATVTWVDAITGDLSKANNLVEQFVSYDWQEVRDNLDLDIDDKNIYLSGQLLEKEKRENQIFKIFKVLEEVKVKLSGSIVCPKCEHEFVLGGNIEELKEKRTTAIELNGKIEKVKNNVEKLILDAKTSIELVENDISKINKKETIEIFEKK